MEAVKHILHANPPFCLGILSSLRESPFFNANLFIQISELSHKAANFAPDTVLTIILSKQISRQHQQLEGSDRKAICTTEVFYEF